ncbi:MAG TPA: transketolase [Actinocrinis sp.]|uniref:transketolase n=1 Tax=Actinocrinis sp. TaxID=1920516 RepID=UPI002DDCEC13|nr:transketolase [Actinocrinis sp.]HEV3168689.1 transketolase [Actinocrinis sp.]
MSTPSAFEWTELDKRTVDTIRVLAMDAVQKVGNGHPGTAMSLAPAAFLLFQKHLRHDPADPKWVGRDRFVLSPGHSSLTLYIELYLSGYGLTLDDLKSFRTWGSLTPGHPEHGHTVGVETTTGPLGQGLSNAVGMAMAARYERGLFDPDAAPGTSPFDHHIYAFASDGDLEEGVTSEASSIAGTQKLGNLVVIYDDNHISIEGDTKVAFTEDVLKRYEAYGWHTQAVEFITPNGYVEDVEALHRAILAAEAETDRPSIIRLRTIIAWPAPDAQNTGKAHGSALGEAEVAATKVVLGFDPEKHFDIADEVLEHARRVGARGKAAHTEWETTFEAWRAANPQRAAEFDRISRRELPAGWDEKLPAFPAGKDLSTRKASEAAIQAIAEQLPEFWGGSADLAESNNTTIKGGLSFLPSYHEETPEFGGSSPYGRILHFGIREHAMGSILNGITLHGNTRPFGGTFLIFSDYMRPAVRLASLMHLPVTYVWTHDSVGLGEDGPTHQPVEHYAALRAIPGLSFVRPADANEAVAAWKAALEQDGPVGLALTRQNIPVFDHEALGAALSAQQGVKRGGYVLAEASDGAPKVILIGTGSEAQLAVAAREKLEESGIPTRVVSMPCVEWFDAQDDEYKESVLPKAVKARVSVEAGVAQPWYRFVGDAGRTVSLEHYGASADYKTIFREFGITAEAVEAAARESLTAVQATASH